MDVQDIASIVGMASIFVAGANFVIIVVSKTFWRLTFERKEEDDIKKFDSLSKDLKSLRDEVRSHEEKNKYFRHNFETVTKNLEAYISGEIVTGKQIS